MLRKLSLLFVACLSLGCALPNYAESDAVYVGDQPIFATQKFTSNDGVLVSDQSGQPIYQWQAEKPLVPASLMKLVTAHLAIEKWGLQHRFETEFYLLDSQLWVKGYGDPYLVSEEMDVIVASLKQRLARMPESIHIDTSYFATQTVPGRSNGNDPYNAPSSAVAANFNTVAIKSEAGQVVSAEPQTPLTQVAKKIAQRQQLSSKITRINLGDAQIAQQHFAQLLLAKLQIDQSAPISIDQTLPSEAKLVLRHQNTRTLDEVLRGTLEFSNNFIANQLFLIFADEQQKQMDYKAASAVAEKNLNTEFEWSSFSIEDGSGLSRRSRLSAAQINQLLTRLAPHKALFKAYPIGAYPSVSVRAKTGTLNDVHNFAGYIQMPEQQYQFVFMFNRAMPYRYRQTVLADLVEQLARRF